MIKEKLITKSKAASAALLAMQNAVLGSLPFPNGPYIFAIA